MGRHPSEGVVNGLARCSATTACPSRTGRCCRVPPVLTHHSRSLRRPTASPSGSLTTSATRGGQDMSAQAEAANGGRALILAGGGLKVAFQAGVLQVWLDEAKLTFSHADGRSGGTFNLAMYCQHMSGRQIADNWRNLRPLKGVSPNWRQYLKGPYASSLLTLDGYRRHVFPAGGWTGSRSVPRTAARPLISTTSARTSSGD